MEKAEIFYLKETEEGTIVKRLMVEGYQLPQLNRIEEKLDKLLNLIRDKER